MKKTYSKAIEEVVETPGDDDIVVEGDKQGDDAGGDSDATEPRMDLVPHAESAQSHSLSDAEFNQEQGYTLQHQHDHERNEEGTWN